jgi:hypothetical protein
MRAMLLILLLGCADDPPPTTGSVTEQPFRSDVVDDDYLLRIRLPPEGDGPFPLILQLDPTFVGLEQFALSAGFVSQHAADGDWPEAIVVGVDYPDPFTRERDYTPEEPLDPAFGNGGADAFYRVLRDEVLPHLQATLPVDPDRQILVGHSNGGVFGWYSTFRHDEGSPPLFAGVIAADAGIDEPLFTFERWHAERATDLPMYVYATHALYNGATQKVTFDALIERLQGRAYPSLQLEEAWLPTDHGGAVAPSIEGGLDWLFGVMP